MKVKVPIYFEIGATSTKVGMKPYIQVDEGYRGYYNQRTGCLDIEASIKGQMRDRIFMHETAHVIDVNYNCGLTEDLITRFGHGFLEFLNQLGIELDWSDIEEANA